MKLSGYIQGILQQFIDDLNSIVGLKELLKLAKEDAIYC